MGSCYSRMGSRSGPFSSLSSQSPIDRKTIECNRVSNEIIDAKKALNSSDCHSIDRNSTAGSHRKKCKNNNKRVSSNTLLPSQKYLSSSSFEEIGSSEVQNSLMASAHNKQKIPLPASKLGSQQTNRVVPKQQHHEIVDNNKYIRRFNPPTDAPTTKDILVPDSSSSTSLSSASSSICPKSYPKSTSSSSTNSVVPASSIPKPKSRSPTPSIPVRNLANVRSLNAIRNDNNKNIIINQSTSTSNERQNGTRSRMNAKTRINSESAMNANQNQNMVKTNASTGNSIRCTTQITGLPRPQTAHIVCNPSPHDSSLKHYHREDHPVQYSDRQQQVKCDESLRQGKPTSYYFGMNKPSCPYKRPNFNLNSNKPIQLLPAEQKTTNGSNINNNQFKMCDKQSPYNTTSSNPIINAQKGHENAKYIPLGVNQSLRNSANFHTSFINRNGSDQLANSKFKIKESNNTSMKELNSSVNATDSIPESLQKIKEVVAIKNKETEGSSQNKKTQAESIDVSSPEHNSISSTSGTETDNRDFLIDDEICDQPELVFTSSLDKNDLTLKSSLSELEALKLKQSPDSMSLSSTSISSSPSTIITNPTTFRRPRPLSFVESSDGSVGLDSPSFRAASQDLIGIKTLLFRLQGILQNAETSNPFDNSYSPNKFYHQLLTSENDESKVMCNNNDVQQENLDLKRQLILMQQQLEDKDRTIRLLQQQMSKYSNMTQPNAAQTNKEMVNSASQTDRCRNASAIDPRAVSDGSNGMLVSACCIHPIDQVINECDGAKKCNETDC